MTDLEPTTPQEYILKGVVNAVLGQEQGIVCLVLTYMLLYSLCFCIGRQSWLFVSV